MSTDEYVPSDEDMESRYVLHSLSLFDFMPEEREACMKALGAEFRRGLARARRDAWQEGAQAQADTYGGQIDTGPNPYEEAR